jgi:exopolysaccharide biosynthesis protein
MRKPSFFRRHGYAVLFTIVLAALTAFVLLDTFVFARRIAVAETDASIGVTASVSAGSGGDAAAPNEGSPSPEQVLSDSSYTSDDVNITIMTLRVSNTDVYVADIRLSSADALRTALAKDVYGTNITETTSTIAAEHNAIFAINGDYYGASKRGYVIKNGVIYRDTVRMGDETEDLVIYADGSFDIIDESEISAQELIDNGVVQLLAFGPVLVENGELTVSKDDEVDRASTSNPRTAIGVIDALHYIFVVSDGRTNQSEGLTLYELSEVMRQYGCITAYNLDGGGSSTMVFAGEVINIPTTNGKMITERAVSDIVYISA